MPDNQLFIHDCSLLFMVVKAYLNTILERIISNARHTIGNGDGGQARAFIESLTSNGRHAVADGDGGQARAIKERIISNGCYVFSQNIFLYLTAKDIVDSRIIKI